LKHKQGASVFRHDPGGQRIALTCPFAWGGRWGKTTSVGEANKKNRFCERPPTRKPERTGDPPRGGQEWLLPFNPEVPSTEGEIRAVRPTWSKCQRELRHAPLLRGCGGAKTKRGKWEKVGGSTPV